MVNRFFKVLVRLSVEKLLRKSFSIICCTLLFGQTLTIAQFAGGSGTVSDPYQITTAQQLDSVRNHLSASFILRNSIDMSGVMTFVPIGSNSAFTGTFDGNGYEINNFTISCPELNIIGLFAKIGQSGTVMNLGVSPANILGYSDVGGIAGWNAGLITNSYNKGKVIGTNGWAGGIAGVNAGIISDSYNTSNNITGLHYIGGIAGQNDGVINTSYNIGNLSASSGNLGGIAGFNGGLINNSFNKGNLSSSLGVGGISGEHFGTINNSYNTGSLTGTNYVGGIVGQNGKVIKNSYNNGPVTGLDYLGGVAGNNYGTNSNTSNCYYDRDNSGAGIKGINGSDFPGQAEGKTGIEMRVTDFVTVLNINKSYPWKQDRAPLLNNGYPILVKVNPVITWTKPSDIIYGILLSEMQLNASSNVPGTFLYSPAIGKKLNAGNNQVLSVEFKPDDQINYSVVEKTVLVTVLKATPEINWTEPDDIIYSTVLSETQLNATSIVPGTFVYLPAPGTKLSANEIHDLSVKFTPDDTVNYNSVMKTVKLVVGIENVLTKTPVLYPNPAKENISVTNLLEFGNSKTVFIEIFSIEGRKVYSGKLVNYNDTEQLNVRFLNRGTYLLKIQSFNMLLIKKFEIE
jgi:hypothetical protein